MDEIIGILDSSGVNVVTYTDDLVILVSGMFLSVMSEWRERWERCACRLHKSNQKYVILFTPKTITSTRISPPAAKWTKISFLLQYKVSGCDPEL